MWRKPLSALTQMSGQLKASVPLLWLQGARGMSRFVLKPDIMVASLAGDSRRLDESMRYDSALFEDNPFLDELPCADPDCEMRGEVFHYAFHTIGR